MRSRPPRSLWTALRASAKVDQMETALELSAPPLNVITREDCRMKKLVSVACLPMCAPMHCCAVMCWPSASVPTDAFLGAEKTFFQEAACSLGTLFGFHPNRPQMKETTLPYSQLTTMHRYV